MGRSDDREPSETRVIRFERHFTTNAPGSVLASFGDTRVLCSATVTDGVPPFLQGRGQGWLTAEYSMLPSSTTERKARDGTLTSCLRPVCLGVAQAGTPDHAGRR